MFIRVSLSDAVYQWIASNRLHSIVCECDPLYRDFYKEIIISNKRKRGLPANKTIRRKIKSVRQFAVRVNKDKVLAFIDIESPLNLNGEIINELSKPYGNGFAFLDKITRHFKWNYKGFLVTFADYDGN